MPGLGNLSEAADAIGISTLIGQFNRLEGDVAPPTS
jgi:hypothetical protein